MRRACNPNVLVIPNFINMIRNSSIVKVVLTILLAFFSLHVFAIEKLVSQEFYRDESTYQTQPIVIPRSSFDNPVTLRRQIETLWGQRDFTSAVVVNSHMGGVESVVYENVDELLDMDPIMLMFGRKGKQLVRKYEEPNVSIYLYYKNEYGKDLCMIMHARSRGILDSFIYTRMSIMHPSEEGRDDLLSFNSSSAPIAVSYLTAFDVKNMSKEIRECEQVLKSAIKKYNNYLKLSELEMCCIEGLTENRDLSESIGYGIWLFEDSRYYDAYVTLKPIYDCLKRNIMPNDNSLNEVFYKTSYMMGVSMWKLGFYETAYYYLSVAAHGVKGYQTDLAAFLEATNGLKSKQPDPEAALKLTCGNVLSLMLDTDMECFREGIANIEGIQEKVASKQNVYNFDLRKLCTDTPSSLTITYDRAKFVSQENTTEDNSRLCFYNNIIFSSVKVDESRWRVNVMVPNFKLCDYKEEGLKYNIPYTLTFIMGKDEADVKPSDSYSSIVANLRVADALFKQRRVLESLTILNSIEASLPSLSDDDKNLLAMSDLEQEIMYQKGYYLQDLMVGLKSVIALESSVKLQPSVRNLQEYINSLTNVNDPRAFETINKELQKPQNDSNYKAFLMRRYAYMLIEFGMLDEAEEVLETLLRMPGCADFARRELEYIKSIKK